jgi:hypothetical protein
MSLCSILQVLLPLGSYSKCAGDGVRGKADVLDCCKLKGMAKESREMSQGDKYTKEIKERKKGDKESRYEINHFHLISFVLFH